MPGEGATAIRAVLSRLSDPAHQRAFLGGDLPKGTPFGVLKPDPADATQAQDWVYDPVGKTAYLRGTQPGEQSGIRDMAYRPDAPENQPRMEYDPVTGERIWVDPKQPRPPRLPKPGDDGPRWVFDRVTGERYWFNPIQLMSLDHAGTQTADDAIRSEGSEINRGLLSPYLGRDERQVGPGVQVAQNAPNDAEPEEPSPDIQEARVREPSNSDKVNAYFDRYDAIIQGMAERLGTKPEFLHAVFSHEGGWGEGDGPVKHNNPSGTMDGDKIKHFNSLEDALQHWERTSGQRIKGTQTIEDFIDRLQKNGKTGTDYYNWVNSRDNPKRSNTGKPYEDLIMDQDRTIRNRREIWQRNRQRPG